MLPERKQRELLAHALSVLKINNPCRIVMDSREHGVMILPLPVASLRIVFELPGVVRVYDRADGKLLAESVPGNPVEPKPLP